MKGLLTNIFKNFLLWRSRKKQIVHIKKLITHLKDKGCYKKFPFKGSTPVISRYKMFRNSDKKWLDFYFSVYGKPDPLFISVPVYYYIESCLNNRMLTYAIKEKNFYTKFMPEIPTPNTYIRRINGFYYDHGFNQIDLDEAWEQLLTQAKIILKPSIHSGGGASIRIFEKNGKTFFDGNICLDIEHIKRLSFDFILQEYIVQDRYFSQFNPSSNNTIRVFIYRSVKDDSINILHCLLRIGAKGNYLDHDHLGGVVLSIDDDNMVSSHAIDLYGNKYSMVNEIELSALGQVPAMDKIRQLASKISGNVYYGRFLALDFTVNEKKEPLLLEINCWRNGISQYQMHNGGLFKEFTEEILDYVQEEKVPYTLSI